MNIVEVIAKAAKGEALTDEEKAGLKEFNPQKQVDSAAAAARKEAEAKAEAAKGEAAKLQKQIDDLNAALKAKDDAGKTDLERAQEQVKQFAGQLKELQGKVEFAEKEKSALVREQKLDSVLREAGIQFIDGVDHKILTRAFNGAFEGIEDLENAEVVKPIVTTFRAMNKGVIMDTSGHGSGNPLKGASGGAPVGLTGKPVDQMSPAEREKDLKERGMM